MNWKGFKRKQSWPNLSYNSGVFLDGLRKSMRIVQDSQSMSQDLNPEFHEYKAGVQPVQR